MTWIDPVIERVNAANRRASAQAHALDPASSPKYPTITFIAPDTPDPAQVMNLMAARPLEVLGSFE